MLKRLHHIGIAVAGLDEGNNIWGPGGVGLTEQSREDVPSQATRVAMYPIGDSRIELLESMDPDGPVANFLEKRGPGVHHLCFEVDDIYAETVRIRASGVRVLYAEARPGAHGSLVNFLHPKDTGGVLIELNEFKKVDGEDGDGDGDGDGGHRDGDDDGSGNPSDSNAQQGG